MKRMQCKVLQVKDKESGKIFTVYDVQYDLLTNKPLFLIYRDGKWLLYSSTLLEPFDTSKVLNEGS